MIDSGRRWVGINVLELTRYSGVRGGTFSSTVIEFSDSITNVDHVRLCRRTNPGNGELAGGLRTGPSCELIAGRVGGDVVNPGIIGIPVDPQIECIPDTIRDTS
jgi:hypothetical protein